MKIKFCCVIVTILLSSLSYSQEKGKIFIALEQGINFPVGQFGDKHYEMMPGVLEAKVNGIANNGYVASLAAGYYFHKHLAAVINAGFSTNNQRRQSIEDSYGGVNSGYMFDTDTDPWKIWRFMGGLTYDISLPQQDKFFLQTTVLAGFAKTRSPGYEIAGVSNTGGQPSAFQVKYSGFKLDPAFCWQADVGVGYWLEKNVYLMINTNYFDSRPEHQYIVTLPGNPNNGQEASVKYRLSAVGLNAKIGVRF